MAEVCFQVIDLYDFFIERTKSLPETLVVLNENEFSVNSIDRLEKL